MLLKRNNPRCIQNELLTYRQIRLPAKFYQNDEQQLTMEMKKDSVDMDDINSCTKQQLIKKDSSDLDHEAAIMVKGFDILQSVTEQKEGKTGNASVSLHPDDVSDKDFLANDIKQMVQNLTDNKIKGKDNTSRWVESLENKLSAMCAQSVHQFNQVSLHVSNLLEEHKVTAVKFRASKDEVESLRGRIDLSDFRCTKLESLICEAMDEHETTKGKFRQQLALGKKRLSDIHDLNDEIACKDKALARMERSFSKVREERVELEKINAERLMSFQKELDDCRRAFARKREECNDLKEQHGMLMKEKMVLAGSLTSVNERFDAQQHKSSQLEVDVERLSMEKKDLEKKLDQESSAKFEISLKLDKVTHAGISQRSKNQVLAKELASAVAKNDDLQGSLDKVLSKIKNTQKACDREKMSRKSLNDKTMAIMHEKDAELLKVKKKLESTKIFLASINHKAESKQDFKAHRCTGVGSEKDVTCGNVVQPEEKKTKRKRRGGHKKKKGTGEKNNSSTDSLEIIRSLNKGKTAFFIIDFLFLFQY